MSRRLILSFICIAVTLPLYSQYFAKGRLLNLASHLPVSFANIGIINSGIGTISNGDGSFEIRIPANFSKDSIIFSALGYDRLYIPVSDFTPDKFVTVYLKESPVTLNAVTVTGEKWKEKEFRLGYRNYEGSGIYADTVMAGSAMALLIKTDNWTAKNKFSYPMYIKEVQLMIVNNTFGEFKVRTRLYAVDPVTKLPGNDLLNHSIVTRTKIETGRLKIDLSGYNIEIKGNFFLGFEWILDKDDRRYLYEQYEGFRRDHPEKISEDTAYIEGNLVSFTNYNGNLYAGPSFGISVANKNLRDQVCFYRLNSFGKWHRSLFILSASTVLGDKPSIETGPDSTDYAKAGDQPVELMPFYIIESLIPDLETGPVTLKLKNPDSGSFAGKISDPVRIQVRRQNNQIAFYADNRSLYPYQIEMNFFNLKNIGPMISKKSFTVPPGETPLLALKVYDPSIPDYHYELSIKQFIGDTNRVVDASYPYLIPVGNHRKVYMAGSDDARNPFNDFFKLIPDDTVYAMRKGIVTATPGMRNESDRISVNRTLEIMHNDGTVMLYFNIDPGNSLVKTGDVVYPGQAVGIIGKENVLEVELYRIGAEGKIQKININYFTGKPANDRYSDLVNGRMVIYPDSIITREMTEKEIARYSKNNLY
jgi:hypothetical protein